VLSEAKWPIARVSAADGKRGAAAPSCEIIKKIWLVYHFYRVYDLYSTNGRVFPEYCARSVHSLRVRRIPRLPPGIKMRNRRRLPYCRVRKVYLLNLVFPFREIRRKLATLHRHANIARVRPENIRPGRRGCGIRIQRFNVGRTCVFANLLAGKVTANREKWLKSGYHS